MVAGNRPSSLGLPPGQPLDHRHGGRLSSMTGELSIHGMGDDYTVDGNGTIRSLPATPVGTTAVLKIPGYPVFANSSKLICQNNADYRALPGDLIFARSDGDGVWRIYPVSVSGKNIAKSGRLTLTSGVAITTSDVTGATLVYFTACNGEFAELSNDTTASSVGKAGPAAVTTNSIYDLLVWFDTSPGTNVWRLTRSPAWASDTSIGTGAGTAERQLISGTLFNKFDVTNGPLAGQGYIVGSVRSDGSSQLKDSLAFRWVSNVYNTVARLMKVVEATASWNYTTATFRQANGSAANQLDILQSVSGSMLQANVLSNLSNTSSGQYGIVGIDIDTVNTTTIVNNINSLNQVQVAGSIVTESAQYNGYPGIGRHIAIWKEYASAVGTCTFYGTAGGNILQSGIYGSIAN